MEVYAENKFLPLLYQGDAILVAFADPHNSDHVLAAKKIFGDSIVICISRERAILEALTRYEAKGRKSDKGA